MAAHSAPGLCPGISISFSLSLDTGLITPGAAGLRLQAPGPGGAEPGPRGGGGERHLEPRPLRPAL